MTLFKLSSPTFEDDGPIPPAYTKCDGANQSPPLEWSGAPTDTKSFALIVDDPDAPDPANPKMVRTECIGIFVLFCTFSSSTTTKARAVQQQHRRKLWYSECI